MYAFYGCRRIRGAEIPDGATNIGDYAFSETSVANALIPGRNTSLGTGIFSGTPVIYCYRDYPAESWARDNGCPVVFLDGIEVPEAIRTLSIEGVSRLNIGETGYLEAAVFPYSDSPEVLWSSSDPSVAAVANGRLTAISVGTVTITAGIAGSVSAEWRVSVIRDFSSVLTLPESLTAIRAEALSGLDSAEAVWIPASVGEIADDAFDNSAIVIIAPADSYAIQWAENHDVPYIEDAE